MKKKMSLLISILLIGSLFITGCGKEVEVKNGSKVAVSTKGGKITATDYYNEIKETSISKMVDMIDHQLFDEKYKTDKDEDKEVEDQINQIKSAYGSNETTYLNVIKQYFGVDSEKELDSMLRLEYKRTQAVDDYIKDNITDKEVKKYYDENIIGDMKASHILISLNVKDDATTEEKEEAEKKAKEKAEKIIKQLDDGKDFAELAKKNSDDEATAKDGGDLGYFSYDDMVKEFSEATKKLKNKEYTKEPVKTEYGYHIILKTGQKKKPSLKDSKKEILDTLKDQKLQDDPTLHYQALIDIRKENKITWNDSKLKKAYNDLMDDLLEQASQSAQTTQTTTAN